VSLSRAGDASERVATRSLAHSTQLFALQRLASKSAAVLNVAGKAEASLQERWADLGDAADLVAAAPDDEILGEILALQASQMLGNSSIPIAGQVCSRLHRSWGDLPHGGKAWVPVSADTALAAPITS